MTELEVEYDDWHAIHDHMSKTLRVYGTVMIRGAGVAATLEPREEQGVNPEMLMLNLRFTATGESPGRQTPEYTQDWSDEGIQYQEVQVMVVGELSAPPPQTMSIEDVH